MNAEITSITFDMSEGRRVAVVELSDGDVEVFEAQNIEECLVVIITRYFGP